MSNNSSFKFFDVTADIGFYAYGNDLNEAFENAGLALFETMTDTEKIKPKLTRSINIESEDIVSLLYDYLNELLFLHDVEFLFFSKFEVNIIKKDNGKYKLNSKVNGENINYKIHSLKAEVKAITFHMMNVIKNNDCETEVKVILDL